VGQILIFEIGDRVVSPFGEAVILRIWTKAILVRQLDGIARLFDPAALNHSKETRFWPATDINPITGQREPLASNHPQYRRPKNLT